MKINDIAKEFLRVQRDRVRLDLRIQAMRKREAPSENIEFWEKIIEALRKREEELKKPIEEYGKSHQLFEWAGGIYGIGAHSFGLLMAFLDEVGVHNFRYPSALWRFCGLAVVDGKSQSRVSGDEARKWKFHRDARMVLFNISESFVRSGRVYRKMYEDFYAQSQIKHPDWNPGHHHNHAMRLIAKIFLSHLWEEARIRAGLPVHQPYPQAILNHDGYIPPVTPEKKKRKRKALAQSLESEATRP